MKSLLRSFLIMSVLGTTSFAECVYFRVSTKLLQCGAADTKALEALDPYHVAPEAPELEEPTTQKLVQVRCDCEYSLQGSDQRCDMDQLIEKSSVLGADDPSNSCRRGNSLCRDVCPPRLP